MIDVESCRQNAADCVRQAQGEDSDSERDILLNVALAWLRLAQQAQARALEVDDVEFFDDADTGAFEPETLN